MSGVVALFHRDGRPIEPSEVERLLEACPERAVDGQSVWMDGAMALGHQHFWITPEEWGERQPLHDPVTGCVIAGDVRLDNRADLLDVLALARGDDRTLSDAALVLRAYRHWGTGCAEHILGDFVFALWDPERQGLFVARDPLGARSLCYHLGPESAVVASEIVQVLAHPSVPVRLNERKVADHLAFLFDDHQRSFYEEVDYLPPAHCLWVSGQETRRWRYWELQPGPLLRYRHEDDYAEHFRELVRTAVRCRMRSRGRIGISLSGGLDSSLLAALGADLLPQTVPSQPHLEAFSYAFDELSSCDERPLIRPMVARYGLNAHYLPCDQAWTLHHPHAWPVYRDYVLWDPYAWLPWEVMQAAQQADCRVLLAGYYGDALCGPGRFWAADLLRRWQLGALVRIVAGSYRQVRWRRDLIDCGIRALAPEALKMLRRRLRGALSDQSFGLQLHPSFIARTCLQQRLEISASRRITAKSLRERWARDLTANCYSQPPGSVRKAYHAHGIELESPYHDRRLVEYVLALPGEQLGRPGADRWVHRRALSGLVPESVRERNDRTVFTPLMEKGLLDRERGTVQSIMRRSQIVEREIVDGGWLRQQLTVGARWAGDGLPLWLCISLELWLRRHWS